MRKSGARGDEMQPGSVRYKWHSHFCVRTGGKYLNSHPELHLIPFFVPVFTLELRARETVRTEVCETMHLTNFLHGSLIIDINYISRLHWCECVTDELVCVHWWTNMCVYMTSHARSVTVRLPPWSVIDLEIRIHVE